MVAGKHVPPQGSSSFNSASGLAPLDKLGADPEHVLPAAFDPLPQLAEAPIGVDAVRDWLREAEPALNDAGVALCELRRDWDASIWPHASAGFFKVKKKITDILCRAGLS